MCRVVCLSGGIFLLLGFLFFFKPAPGRTLGGRERKSKDNPEVGRVPLPTLEARQCGPGSRNVGPNGLAGQGAAAAGQQSPGSAFQSLPESWGEPPEGCPLPCALVVWVGHTLLSRVLAGVNPRPVADPDSRFRRPSFLSFK